MVCPATTLIISCFPADLDPWLDLQLVTLPLLLPSMLYQSGFLQSNSITIGPRINHCWSHCISPSCLQSSLSSIVQQWNLKASKLWPHKICCSIVYFQRLWIFFFGLPEAALQKKDVASSFTSLTPSLAQRGVLFWVPHFPPSILICWFCCCCCC